MKRIWLILATLTLARMTMGYQFQSVASVGPVLTGGSILTHTQLGALIGVYLGFGALFAVPGGWFGKRFGDKRVVLVGLAMMTLGGALLAASQAYEVMLFGRLLSGPRRKFKVIATGGDARLVRPYSQYLRRIDETLIHRGLALVALEKLKKNS